MIGKKRICLGVCPVVALSLAAALWSAPAAADLGSAQEAYSRGDYEKAFKEYRELAELGQPMAQFDLAVMYAKGQGVRKSEIYAYAWATLADENGWEGAKALLDVLRPSLKLAPGSEQVAADIEAQYGRTVLAQRLMPKIQEAEVAEATSDRSRCRLVRAYEPAYPTQAQFGGMSGSVYVEFSLMPDGRSRNPHIIYSVPTQVFDGTARDALLHSQFRPAPPDTAPVRCTMFYQFVFEGAHLRNYDDLSQLVQQTFEKAQSGDPHEQMLYGMLLVGLPQLNRPREEALPWFLKAAQGGSPLAQFQIGYSLVKGWGCDCDENKGFEWLRRAAQSGQPKAEVTLAMYALRGNPDAARWAQAKLWLEQAAASGDHDGKLYLAALLATAEDVSTRDPQRALKLLDEVFRGVRDDPTAYEIRGAADASAGKFRDAVSSERRAIFMAHKLKWDTTPLEARLAHYTANQPWSGALLDF